MSPGFTTLAIPAQLLMYVDVSHDGSVSHDAASFTPKSGFDGLDAKCMQQLIRCGPMWAKTTIILQIP